MRGGPHSDAAAEPAPWASDQTRQIGHAVTRTLIVDDHPAVRAGLEAVLRAEGDFEVIAVVPSAREALAVLRRHSVDLAVLDYQLPGEDGLALCHRLKASALPPRVLIYSAFADAGLAIRALIAGADGVASKAALSDDLCVALRRVARGECVLPAISPSALEAVGSMLDPADLPVLGMLMHRIPGSEVADTLGVPEDWLAARRWAMLERLRPGRTEPVSREGVA